ncbi:MAG: hydantoinase/oxoprolinase family protein, partial [bacterium]|nr:hydantoinase/oxoprolinase family protein [bacterium]
LIHGTTVSTNAFLQNKMAKTAFLCTENFQHILYIGRQNRTDLFSLETVKPSPIIPLDLCHGIAERTLKDGSISRKPIPGDIEALGHRLKKEGVESIGILFLHSYRNPENEQIAAAILRKQGFYVTASHEIMPEYREYERGVITILNATLQPVIADYVGCLKKALKQKRFYIIQSNGGILSPDRIIKAPIRTIISGPAGGVIAAKKIAAATGTANLITLDMGGTSTDVSVIKNGELSLTKEGSVEHLPLRLPMVDIATVGAGGGSIARVDKGGVLQVGPDSAGAVPGPACYGHSMLPTITDAFIVTGAILPHLFLDGKMEIFPKRSIDAVESIAKKIGKSIYETAEGIINVSVSSMERALRSVTLEKGEDPRFYTLMPFGGAGGLAASLLAEKLGIQRILIPPHQGVFSALGMLAADFKIERLKSILESYSPSITSTLDPLFAGLTDEAKNILKEEGFPIEKSHILLFLDMRYKGQSYELTIPYEKNFIKRFHEEHKRLYSYSLEDERCEIVNLRVLATGETAGLTLKKKKFAPGQPSPIEKKDIYYNTQFQNFNIYRRKDLSPGNQLQVPAIVISKDATVVIDKDSNAKIDEFLNIVITRT